MLLPLLSCGGAPAAEIRIEAAVDRGLGIVTGRMTLSADLAALPLVDPLAALPTPRADLHLFRTFPGAPSAGSVRWVEESEGVIRFETHLPRRFGTIGATGHGLFGSGGWYPQPFGPGGLPRAEWDVTVTLPEGAGGALGDVVDTGTLRWEGRGERVGLAVVRKPRFTPLEAGRSDLIVVSRGPPRRVLIHQLERALAQADPLEGAIAVAPLRRRLTGHAPGLAYVSDRAFRLTAGLRFVHRSPAVRGIAAALVDQPDPLDREIAAAAIARVYDARQRSLDADRLLRRFRWVPQIDALLSSQRIPFYSEVLDLTWPADPVRDDLCEMFDPYAPGTAVMAQLDDRYGDGVGEEVGLALAAGDGIDEALSANGVPPSWIGPWRAEFPDQDYVLAVSDGQVTVGRIAPSGAPPETLIVRADGVDHPVRIASGYEPIPLPSPVHRVALDPERHVRQRSRRGDSWPPRYDWTASGWLDSIDLGEGILYLGALATLRRQYDTRNLFVASASNSRANLLSADVGFLRKEGRLLDGYNRPHRIRGELGASVLNPSFDQSDSVRIGVDGTLGWAVDNRVSSDFPLRGRRIGLSATAGGVPGSATNWIGASLHGTQIGSFHPRWAVGVDASVSVAQSDLPHRLLSLGGPSAMRSVPALPACDVGQSTRSDGLPCLVVADGRAVAASELRWAPIRGASVPMLLAWGTELQLTLGTEAILAHLDDGEIGWGTGLTAGAFGLGDLLGAQSSGIGLTAGWLLAASEAGLGELLRDRTAVPEIYLRFEQAF